ncbi:MAG TPA: NADH-quinone oxidoreductase subunit A [Acidimicrobiales bacterium]|nr:NADH-quinone oxidoreductase subunit A [Acidimicrobiales bacterium]
MVQYLPVFAMLVLATLFAGISFLASRLLAPRRATAAKLAPYECGIVPDREPAERFPVRFFLVAMIFIIFDIEIIFLFPWAVIFSELGLFGLAEMAVFAVAVFVSFLWLISRGALDWAPARVSRPLTERLMRTSENTVVRLSNRIPLDGGPSPDDELEPAARAS